MNHGVLLLACEDFLRHLKDDHSDENRADAFRWPFPPEAAAAATRLDMPPLPVRVGIVGGPSDAASNIPSLATTEAPTRTQAMHRSCMTPNWLMTRTLSGS